MAHINLPGLPGNENRVLFPDWADMNQLPVIVDAFDQPVLYYVAGTHGRATNMLEDAHLVNNDYSRGTPQQEGTPFFFHQDNEGFTGTSSDPEVLAEHGWDFGGRPKGHAIGNSGALLTADQVVDPVNRETFARYIIDRKIFESVSRIPTVTAPLRPVNAESYLLITAGTDGR